MIPLVTAGVAAGGRSFSRFGMEWYRGLKVPSWTPAGSVIGRVWLVLYVTAALSAALALNAAPAERYTMVAALYAVNAFLNLAWPYLFFVRRQIGSAALEALLLAASVAVIQGNVLMSSPVAAVLLLPYLGWTLFAARLTYAIYGLN
jgi:benzodiazapine receptor